MGLLKSNSDLRALHEAGRIARIVMAELGGMLAPGTSTVTLEREAVRLLSAHRSTAPFRTFDGFNHAICVSINDEVVNSPPSRERIIQDGDVVKIATAAEHRGLHAKIARTWFIGAKEPADTQRLITGTAEAIHNCIEKSRQVDTLNALLETIPETASKYSLRIIGELGGAGIGKKLHDQPFVPNNPTDLTMPVPLQPGLTFTLMPMFTLGGSEFFMHEDGWTYMTSDHSLSAHFADTVMMTENGLVSITNPTNNE